MRGGGVKNSQNSVDVVYQNTFHGPFFNVINFYSLLSDLRDTYMSDMRSSPWQLEWVVKMYCINCAHCIYNFKEKIIVEFHEL